jgi:hypothetical protein
MFKSELFFPLLAAIGIFASAVPAAGQDTNPVEFRDENTAPVRFDKALRAVAPRVATPAFKPLATGLQARQIVEARSAEGDYNADIWSLLVGPATETSEARLPGAAVLSVNAGKVDVLVGSEKRSLGPGTSTQVAEGASFKLINTDKDRPALLRAIVLSAGR